MLVSKCSRPRQNFDLAGEGDVVVGQIVTTRECSAADYPRQDYLEELELY